MAKDITSRNQCNKEKLHRYLSLSVREIDDETRSLELSFSSESPYERYWGTEILDHSEGCMEIKRISEMGCLLYNHNRDKVIGAVERVWIENGRGKAIVRFDDDEESDIIFKKVKNKSLRGVSVGYLVTEWETVGKNNKSQDGRFTGPCDIARRWEPYEISIVSIPADTTVGVGRALENNNSGRPLDSFCRQLQINQNRQKARKTEVKE